MANPFRAFPASMLLAATAAAAAQAEVPRLLGYQGRLLRSDGTAATGTATVTFFVFDAAEGGSALWQERQTLGLSDGYYSTFLGLVSTPSEALFDGGGRWIEIRVGSETLSPRQRIGTSAYALAARSVAGGTADVASLKVSGQTVVDANGRLSGTARYTAGPGLAVDDSTQTVSLLPCEAGQVLVRDASTWQCVTANPGTVISVSAVGPLVVTNATSTPQISLPRAGSWSDGYLASSDWSAFNAKYGALTQCGGDLSGALAAPTVTRLQSRPLSATGPTQGQVIKWNLSQWEPGFDLNSGGTVTAVTGQAPLTVWYGSTTPEISIAAASASADGYMASADFARFDAKYGAATQCGGDLEGALAAPVVAKLQGVRVLTTPPTTAQVLRFDGSGWAPASLGIADVGGLSSGYLDLSGDQTIAGTKTFTAAPVFGAPLGAASGGTGASTAAPHSFLAGPSIGSAAALPGFRALDAADLPAHDASLVASGTLGVARGGTGSSSLEANRILLGNGTVSISALGAGTAGQVLVSGGSGVPSWQTWTSSQWASATGGIAYGGGRVGIGTTLPSSALDVVGDLHASGTLYGSGAGLTSLDAGSLASGAVPDGRLASTYTQAVAFGNGANTYSGTLTGSVVGSVVGSVAGSVTGGLRGTLVLSDQTTAEPGAVRYSGGHFQGYDGSHWLNLDNVPPPSLTQVAPGQGPASGGTTITITGSNFQPLAGITLVAIDGVACTSVNVAGSNTITAVTPANPIGGAKDVKVTNPDFQSTTLGASFLYLPTVTALAPTYGPSAGGTPVTVTGTAFLSGATMTIDGNACTNVSVANTTTITAATPGGSGGTKNLAVTNPGTPAVTLSSAFTYYDPPTISTVSPSSAWTSASTSVVISGTNFRSGMTVKLGTTTLSATWVSATTVNATVPAMSAAARDVIVTNSPDGQSATKSGGFTHLLAGSSSAAADTNCLAILNHGGSTGTGVYWINAGGTAFQAYCDMSYSGGGWTLVGKGRQGWSFSDSGQGTNADLTGSPTAYSVAYLTAAQVNSILGKALNASTDGLRLARTEVSQEIIWKFSSQTSFSWAFENAWAITAWTTGTGGNCSTTGNSSDIYICGPNDVTRVFTWAWSGHNNVRGFSTGSSNTTGWVYSSEQHAIPHTLVYVRQ